MGSEMCIRDSIKKAKSSNPVFILDEIDKVSKHFHGDPASALLEVCLLYTSDAADERSSVDLGGRRIIKKKTRTYGAR